MKTTARGEMNARTTIKHAGKTTVIVRKSKQYTLLIMQRDCSLHEPYGDCVRHATRLLQFGTYRYAV